jgi:hypothetical protein
MSTRMGDVLPRRGPGDGQSSSRSSHARGVGEGARRHVARPAACSVSSVGMTARVDLNGAHTQQERTLTLTILEAPPGLPAPTRCEAATILRWSWPSWRIASSRLTLYGLPGRSSVVRGVLRGAPDHPRPRRRRGRPAPRHPAWSREQPVNVVNEAAPSAERSTCAEDLGHRHW